MGGRTRCAATLAVIAVVTARGALAPVAWAEGAPSRSVLGLAPPARDAGHARRRRLAADLAAAIAKGRDARVASPAPPQDAAPLARARARFEAGALDEAATVLDLAAAAAARAPDAAGDPTPVVEALVVRAAIALAQGEAARADELLGRLLRWDPGLVLAPGEASPRLEEALRRVRAVLGSRPALGAADLGDACARAPTLVVVRRLDAASLELTRWEDCRLTTRVVTRPGERTDALARALVPPAVSAPPPAPAEAQGTRWWLWGTVGAVAVAALGGFVLLSDGGDDRVDVRPHP